MYSWEASARTKSVGKLGNEEEKDTKRVGWCRCFADPPRQDRNKKVSVRRQAAEAQVLAELYRVCFAYQFSRLSH